MTENWFRRCFRVIRSKKGKQAPLKEISVRVLHERRRAIKSASHHSYQFNSYDKMVQDNCPCITSAIDPSSKCSKLAWYKMNSSNLVAKCECIACRCDKESLIQEERNIAQALELTTSDFSVKGMTCSSCVNGIESYLKSLPGINQVNVNLIANLAVVKHDPAVIDAATIKETIDDLGYSAELIVRSSSGKLLLKLEGVTSSADISRLRSLLHNEDPEAKLACPVERFNYDDATSVGTVIYSPEILKQRDIIAFINENTGLKASLHKGSESASDRYKRKKEINKYKKMFLISLLFAVPAAVMMILMATPVMDLLDHTFIAPGLNVKVLIMFVLTTPVQFWLGKGFFVAAGASLRNRKLTMDSLIVVGTMAAYLYSIVSRSLAKTFLTIALRLASLLRWSIMNSWQRTFSRFQSS